jgi:hypothetical protein
MTYQGSVSDTRNSTRTCTIGGFNRVRTGIYELTPLFTASDDSRPVFRFINTVASRVRAADGLGVCWLDAAAHDDRVVAGIRPSFDGRVGVQLDEGRPELRVRGLEDQPHDWTRM